MFTVYLVDDDHTVLRALSRFLGAKGYGVQPFSSAQEFLAQHDPGIPGCAVLDLSLPGLNGLQLQQALTTAEAHRPVIFLTGKGNIPTSVQAMRAGAIDFLTKPVRKEELLRAIEQAQSLDFQSRQTVNETSMVRAKTANLTPRELQVLSGVVAGQLNKQIADGLGTAEKTVKFHRGRTMQKLGVRKIPDLVRLAGKAVIPAAKP